MEVPLQCLRPLPSELMPSPFNAKPQRQRLVAENFPKASRLEKEKEISLLLRLPLPTFQNHSANTKRPSPSRINSLRRHENRQIMAFLILSETSAGYALFKAKDKKLLKKDNLAKEMSTPEGAASL